jgi:AraC-like DNA-binding protein
MGDTLSQLLQSLRLERAHFARQELCTGCPLESAEPFAYYFVEEGGVELQVGVEARLLREGQAVLLPHPRPHRLCLAAGVRAGPARLIVGRLGVNPMLCPLMLAGLPSLLPADGADPPDPWVGASLRRLVAACSGSPGAEAVATKLAEVLVGEALMAHFAREMERTGSPSAVTDRILGRCLALMHERPAHPWTLEALAMQANTSRSVLSERFADRIGMPPMAYLCRLRMTVAREQLQLDGSTVAQVAAAVGYETDAAFIRAFRRVFGVPPAAWRRAQKAAAAARAQRPGAAERRRRKHGMFMAAIGQDSAAAAASNGCS